MFSCKGQEVHSSLRDMTDGTASEKKKSILHLNLVPLTNTQNATLFF